MPSCQWFCYFVLSLAQHGLALDNVKGYLSAISACLQLLDQSSLFKSSVVMLFLKKLHYLFPPSPFYMPQWDLNLVLTFLMFSSLEPMHSCS